MVQLQADNPDLQFVDAGVGQHHLPGHHGDPLHHQNQSTAEEWINYVYDRANYAKLVAFTQYVPVLRPI